MTYRYALRKEQRSEWTVYDIFTGLPVTILGFPMVDMDIEEADEVAELLNLQDDIRRGKASLARPRA